MEPSTQKLIHTFGALADLGEESAGRGDFSEMVRTSMHLLLGTLALRRGEVAECIDQGELRCVALWGLEPRLFTNFSIEQSDKDQFLNGQPDDFLLRNPATPNTFLNRHR